LIKGSSENLVVDVRAQVFAEIETHVRTACWISSVTSSSFADEPSRGDNQRLIKPGFKDVSMEAYKCGYIFMIVRHRN
jgi:hypothetical protein